MQKLGDLTENTRLIAVLFADEKPGFAIISELKKASFAGVMLDTMHKKWFIDPNNVARNNC